MKTKMKKIIKFIKKYLNRIITVMIVILIAIVFITFVTSMNKKANTTTIEDVKLYQMEEGHRVTYTGKLTMSQDGDTDKIELNDKDILIDSSPLYYDGEDKLIFPKTMGVIFPLNNVSQYRIPNYTFLDNSSSNFINLTYKTKKYDLENAFLYDGNDLYVFIEKTNLSIDGNIIELAPMSYVEYNTLTNRCTYYNYGGDSKVVDVNSEVKAYTDKYEVNLGIDGVKYKDDYKLLIKKIDVLNKLF